MTASYPLRAADLPYTYALIDASIGRDLALLEPQQLELVLDRAYDLALFPLIYQAAKIAGHKIDPTNYSRRQRKRWREHRIRQALIRQSLIDILKVLDGVEFVLLKGASLSERLYGDASWRDTGDIDLLIDLGAFEKVEDRLAEIGYRAQQQGAPQIWVNNEYSLVSERSGVVVELHWALALPRIPSPPVQELFAERIYHHAEGVGRVPVLGIEHGLLQACYHYHHHKGFLKGLFDIAGWLDRYAGVIDMEKLYRITQGLGVKGIIQWPFLTIENITGKRVFERRNDVATPVKIWSMFSAEILKNVLLGEQRIKGRHPLAFKTQEILKGELLLWSSASMLLLDSPKMRIAGLLSPIFLGPNVMAAKLGKPKPDAETWLRIIGRPLELAIKQLRELKPD